MNKSFQVFLFSTMSILLVAAAIYIFFLSEKPKANDEPTVEEILELSVDIPEITTNLSSDHYINIAFKIQTDRKDAKKELEKREFQVNNIIIKHLSSLEAKDILTTEGKIQLEQSIKEKINAILQNGKVEQVYITSCIIQ
ncbi:flagellar basal body-associated protein FliL [Fervidibacillus halotolerans]|uniref:Flagellar protein FliL n=1 Tax=Fervidibacillus halotolerans TaxID=2980027 RepID=A0A9E8M1R6_9BACI|nr:flagellar basal body-associated protein FliL [Fervidibacillus halotolerans]WAA13596.1 flagellar basal body-associated protein FliL [Fervidibacillus halotolerans]